LSAARLRVTRVTDADFSDKTIKGTEMDEEAVACKTDHVKEEMVIRGAGRDLRVPERRP
jgi:hypothetical protein